MDAARDELGVAPDDALAGWIVEHPLQAFSTRYFEPGSAGPAGLVSYDASALRAAQAGEGETPELIRNALRLLAPKG